MQSHVEVGGAVRGPFDRRPILILVLEDRWHILRAFCSQLLIVFRSHTVSRNTLDLATAHRERRLSVAFVTFGLRCIDCVSRLRLCVCLLIRSAVVTSMRYPYISYFAKSGGTSSALSVASFSTSSEVTPARGTNSISLPLIVSVAAA